MLLGARRCALCRLTVLLLQQAVPPADLLLPSALHRLAELHRHVGEEGQDRAVCQALGDHE